MIQLGASEFSTPICFEKNTENSTVASGEETGSYSTVANDGFTFFPNDHCWRGAAFKSFIKFVTAKKGIKIAPDSRFYPFKDREPVMATMAPQIGELRISGAKAQRSESETLR